MKSFEFFKKGRKVFFTLALFILVFALSCIVKIQAAGNVTGWLWGGSEDSTIGGSIGTWPPDGNETGVGWISMSGANYGVTIPASGPVTGYAWASASDIPNDPITFKPDDDKNGLGWIQFDPSGPYPTTGCDGVCPDYSTRRNGNILEGWARFVSIRDALAVNNSGGWEGWIKMKGSNYGVDVAKMKGDARTPADATYAWSNELGWIDFSRASTTVTPTLTASGTTLTSGQPCRQIFANLADNTGTKTITFDATAATKVFLSASATCQPLLETLTCDITGNGSCSVYAYTSEFTQGATENIPVTNPGLISSNAPVIIVQTLNCTIYCPPSTEITAGGTKDIPVSVSGAGCQLDACSESSDLLKDATVVGSSCRVTAETTSRYGSATVTANAGSNSANCPVNIKGPGWIETNP